MCTVYMVSECEAAMTHHICLLPVDLFMCQNVTRDACGFPRALTLIQTSISPHDEVDYFSM